MSNESANSKHKQGFTISEMIMTLGIIGLLAITMLSLNNPDNNKMQIAQTKLAQTDSAVRAWGKAVTAAGETGLGATATITDQDKLVDSLEKSLNVKETSELQNNGLEALNNTVLGSDALKGYKTLTLNNDVKLHVKYTNFEGGEDSSIAIIVAEADAGKDKTVTEEYALFQNRIEAVDDLYDGYVAVDVKTVPNDDGTTTYYACTDLVDNCAGDSSLCDAGVAGCTLVQEDYLGTSMKIWVSENPDIQSCGPNQTGDIKTIAYLNVLGTEQDIVVDHCCNTPLYHNGTSCACDQSKMTFNKGYIFDADDLTTCEIKAPKGTYADGSGNKIIVKLGHYTDEEGLNEQITCPVGYFCPNIVTLQKYNIDTEGKFYTITDADKKTDDYIENEAKITGLTDKIAAPPGYVCDTEGLEEPTICPAGYYCLGTSGTSVSGKTPCPKGTYNPEQGKLSADACILCPAGTYNDEVGQTECKPCKGSTQEGATVCVTCPVGTYNNAGTCTPCKAGTYNDETGMSECKSCPEHSGTDGKTGSTSISECKCDAGYYTDDSCSELNGENSCQITPEDTYSPAYNNCKISCPENSATNGNTGAKAISECKCDGGYYTDDSCSDLDGKNACQLTPKDTYSPAYNNCKTSCPEHSGTNEQQGKSSISECKCDGGYYTDENCSDLNGKNACKITPKDTYSPKYNNCKNGCPENSGTNDKEGKSEISECKCNGGYVVKPHMVNEKDECPYLLQEGDKCEAAPQGIYSGNYDNCGHNCPEGTYNDEEQKKDINECKPCTLGHYCPTPGTITPTACSCGTYMDKEGAIECKIVVAGSYPAVTGENNAVSYANSAATQSQLCPINYVCQGGCNSPQPCPAGYVTESEGAIAIEECIPDPGSTCIHYGDEDLILIHNQEELAKIGKDSAYPLNGNYCQVANIALEGSWTSINNFSGTYDGNDYNITNLNTSEYGLFGTVTGQIMRLGVFGEVINSSAYSSSCVGGLAGTLSNKGKIENSFFNGNVKATADWYYYGYAGGLVGCLAGGTLSSVYAKGDVSSGYYAGGLVGLANSGKIDNAYTNSNVTCNNSVANLGGYYGYGSAGGFVGYIDSGVQINNTYTYSKTSSSAGSYAGYSQVTIKNSYVDASYNEDKEYSCLVGDSSVPVCKYGYCGGVTALATTTIQVSKGRNNIYKDWAEDAWCFNCGAYPQLKNMPVNAPDWTSCTKKCSCPQNATGNYDDCVCPDEAPTYNPVCNTCTSCPLYGTLYVFRRGEWAINRSLKNLIYLSGNNELLSKVNPDRAYVTVGASVCETNSTYICPQDIIKPSVNMEIYLVSRDGDVVAGIPLNSSWSSKDCVTTEQGTVCGLNKLQYSGNACISSGKALTIDGCEYPVSGGYYREISPIVLDLEDDGFSFTSPERGVYFDLNADGEAEKIGWTGIQRKFDNAFLCLDKDNNGNIDNGKELFGDQSGESTGFEELAKYDSNNDGKITKDDTAYNSFLLWVDFDSNGRVDYFREYEKTVKVGGDSEHPEYKTITEREVCNYGDADVADSTNHHYISQCHTDELKTLAEMKITELNTSYTNEYDDNGNLKTDKHGNRVGIVGSFKQLVKRMINGVEEWVEEVKTMIDVFFVSLFD